MSQVPTMNNPFDINGLGAFIDWIYNAPDEELDALKLDELFAGESTQAQIDAAYQQQIEEFKRSDTAYRTVCNTMQGIVDSINELFEEFNSLTEEEVSLAKRKALGGFFSMIKAMADKVIANYPKESAEIFLEKLYPDVRVPEYKNLLDAGADVYARQDCTINPGETFKLLTGFKVSIPEDWKLSVRPRSGISLHTKIRIANAPGTIDPNYLDEVAIIIDNIGDTPIIIKAGERPCQLVLERRYTAKFTVVSDITEYASGNRGGGFGHTGK